MNEAQWNNSKLVWMARRSSSPEARAEARKVLRDLGTGI